MDEKQNNVIGNLIKQKRKEKGLTLVELGKLINVANGTISKWERGAILNMKRDKIQDLCDVLGIPPITFIKGEYSEEEVQTISREQFKSNVSTMIYRCTELSEQEKSILRSILKTL